MTKISLIISVLLISAVFVITRSVSQEHPGEHPGKEHPGEKDEVTKEDLAKAITDYIEKDTKLKGGYFLIYDQTNKKPLLLKLVSVHEDRLSKVSKDVYFACADFKTDDDHTHDLDFLMKKEKGAFDVTEITIHKDNGKARYQGVEEKGFWKRKTE